MRIIGGTAAGRTLRVPPGLGVRPTPDKVRQAIFNSLGPTVEGARVLELFAGTGALSLECLSRGAASALCVEKSAKHASILRRNLAESGLPLPSLSVRVADALQVLSQLAAAGERFDLILADPPYGEKNVGKRSESFAQRLLDDPNLPALLQPDGLFMLGHTRRDTLELPDTWKERRLLKHGDTWIRLLEIGLQVTHSNR